MFIGGGLFAGCFLGLFWLLWHSSRLDRLAFAVGGSGGHFDTAGAEEGFKGGGGGMDGGAIVAAELAGIEVQGGSLDVGHGALDDDGVRRSAPHHQFGDGLVVGQQGELDVAVGERGVQGEVGLMHHEAQGGDIA